MLYFRGATMKFGFLIDRQEVRCSDFSILILPNFEDKLKHFYETAKVSNGWVYGPEIELQKSSNELKEFKQRGPINCHSAYLLPPTHKIKPDIYDEEYLRFLVMGYGFLQGLYLSPEGYSYLWRVPYEPGKLNGLILCGNDRKNGMEQINRFYKNANQDEKKQDQAFAVMHWFLVGQSYTFQWDKFEAQYKVLDGIYNLIYGNDGKPHASRPVKLAERYGVILPQWAKLDSKGKSKLSSLRNELVHEAKYDGSPIGYTHTTENYALEFVSFNTKLICGVLGIDTPYLQSDPSTLDQFAWDIKI